MAEKLRAVVVGCGGIVNAWLGTSTVKEEVEVVGLVDLRREAAEQKAQQHGLTGALVTTDLDEALHKMQPQAVFNCTVPEAHCPVTLAALEHGCHVLTEKPLADTMANARRMVEAARRAGRTMAVIQNRRYIPQVAARKAAPGRYPGRPPRPRTPPCPPARRLRAAQPVREDANPLSLRII